MKARTFEDKVNAGYYKTRDHADFIRDAKAWLREKVPTHVVSKLYNLAVPDPTISNLEMLHNLKRFVELFDPIRIELAIDHRDDRIYYARCPEVQAGDAKPETGWSYEEALGSLVMRIPGSFGFLIERKGKIELESISHG